MPNKFSRGDKVLIKRVDNRTPKHLLENLRLDHPRTIVATFYDHKTQHTRYYLGNNKRGNINPSDFALRASQIQEWKRGKGIGRPRTKRRYKWHLNEPQGIRNKD